MQSWYVCCFITLSTTIYHKNIANTMDLAQSDLISFVSPTVLSNQILPHHLKSITNLWYLVFLITFHYLAFLFILVNLEQILVTRVSTPCII